MKQTLIFIFAALSTLLAQAQNPQFLLDFAAQIADPANIGREEGQLFLKPDEASTERYLPLLQAAICSANDTTVAQLLDKLNENPFIGPAGGPAKIWIVADAQTSLGLMSIRRGSPNVPGAGFRVTTVADGIAKFLVSRTKEELSIAFFKRFKNDLANEVRLNTLFPASTGTLMLIDDQIYQFNQYIDGLQASFQKDMRTLPVNTKQYLTNSKIIASPKLEILAEDVLDISQDMMDGIAADSIISWLASSAACQQSDRLQALTGTDLNEMVDFGAGLKGLNLLSQSLLTRKNGAIEWLDPAKADTYLRNAQARTVFLGLLWQFGDQVRFSDNTTLRDYLSKLAQETKKVDAVVNLVKDFIQSAEDTRSAVRDFKDSNNNAVYEPYYRFFTAFVQMAEAGLSMRSTISGILNPAQASQKTMFNGMKHVNDLYFDVRQKQYSAAIADLIYVLDIFLPGMDTDLRKKILKYGNFMATVAEAQSSDEVAAAIDAVALPPGSSRVKKENYFSAAINAYTGGAGGQEVLNGLNSEKWYAALSAPVGITVSWKLADKAPRADGKYRSPGSFSLFAPIIDVGALVAFRFNDPISNDLPELQWSNLLSPGLYAVYGFGNSLPLSIGLGAQRGPNLRKINDPTRPDLSQTSGWRYGAFLSVDIPVFNLFVQSKKN